MPAGVAGKGRGQTAPPVLLRLWGIEDVPGADNGADVVLLSQPENRVDGLQPRAGAAQKPGNGRLDVAGLDGIERNTELQSQKGIQFAGTLHYY